MDARYRLQDALSAIWARLDQWVDARFGDEAQRKDNIVAQGFKSDAAAIEEAPISLPANVALYVVLTLLVIAILWSIFGTLDRIVVAPGKIATRTPLIVMQPFTTSRILSINVRPGDHVSKGQVLVSFDPAFAQADVASVEHKVRSLNAQIERIEAEMNGTPFKVVAGDNEERATEAQIYDQETAGFSAEMAQRDSQVAAADSQLKADNQSITTLRKQLVMAYKIVDIYQRLLNQQAGAPLDVMKAQSGALDIDTRLKNTIGDANKLVDQRAQIQAERQSFLDKWRSDHNQQLVQARQDLSEATETLSKAQKMKDFTQLRAPADGVVLEIGDRSVGSVLKEAETLVTLVPDGAKLYVEANVSSRDIGYLKVGNPVNVKLESNPFQKYGTLSGRLIVLSADSVPLKEDDTTHLVYHAQVQILETPREMAARGFNLRPGLVASAEIKTGRRSIASYILNPILRTADEGMREP
jgi:HlyD family secretion protein